MKEHFDNFYGKGEASYERKSMINEFIFFASSLRISIRKFPGYLENLDPTRGAPEEQLITLATIHKTKGLEFDYVFIPACVEGFMPCLVPTNITSYDKSNPGKEKDVSLNIENERRLFYVAITRARKAVYIATTEVPKASNDTFPSRFLEEILYDGCQSILNNISNIGSWSNDQINMWLRAVKDNAGNKSLMRNIEKYLQELGHPELSRRVSQIHWEYSESPFKYELAYRNIDNIDESEKETDDVLGNKNFWDDLEDF